jgi:hypothetical protein
VGFQQYYYLENYLFNTVQPRFLEQGYLSAFDFFCIVIWKANRAKSKVAKRLLSKKHGNLDAAVYELTTKLSQQATAKDKLAYLWLKENWGFLLPMASAVLTVLYPEEFTVYDRRVCDMLGDFHNLTNIANIDNLWDRYQKFKAKVEEVAPRDLNLRNKDRYLWGKSFHDQLITDIQQRFQSQQTQDR